MLTNVAATGSQLRPGETPYGVFIRNIVFEANEDDLQLMYEKYGEITKTVIVRDARGLSRG
jgi:RNA recognition motif-containing protein